MNQQVFLGINLLHDTSAAIICNGKLIAAVEQERFDGQRHSTNFPHDAIEFCLDKAGVKRSDIHQTGITFDYSSFILNNRPFEQNIVNHDDLSKESSRIQQNRNLNTYQRAMETLRNNGFENFISIKHHLCHAAGAFFSSGFEKANVLVIDGRGEDESTSFYFGDDIAISKLGSYEIKDSLGHLYTYVTSLCGLYSHIGQEGKTMGLSSYGSGKVSIVDHVLKFDENRYYIDREAMRALRAYAKKDDPFSLESKELAHAVQKAIEKAFVFLAEKLYQKTGNKNFCLAGGVALNCNANGALLALPFVENLYIQPGANDAGAAIGAAMVLNVGQSGIKPIVEEQVYLGPSFTDADTEAFLKQNAITYQKLQDPCATAASLIHQGKVIGWCQGASEFGPRALGNRSILAAPCSDVIRDRVNQIKKRETWRPLAPSILEEKVGEWFTPAVSSPYMLLTIMVLPDKQNIVPGITHVDGTARVQTVKPSSNERYHTLIKNYEALSGIPMVLNTSLNTKGKPIVRTPKDCIQCLYESGLDAIIIGNILVNNQKV